ncbi:BamA/TamA family outer membrane protein [candidate division WOR-3 bacterium]|nr:BamA/TamA family outer membrane protein [candidate division WOR-3 bacterium]
MRKISPFLIIFIALTVGSCGARKDPYSSFARVQRVQISGTEQIDEKDILPYLYTGPGDLYSPFSSSKNAGNIQNYYYQLGFFHARVVSGIDSLTEAGYILLYSVFEGERSLIKSVTLTGFDSALDMSVFKKNNILPGQPLNQMNLSMVMIAIASEYINRGFYNVKIQDTILPADLDSLAMNVFITIDTGSRVFIDQIEILGNRNVRTKIIEMESRLKRGQIFSPDLLNRARSNLYYTGLFSFVSVKPLPSKLHEDSLKVIIKVEESKISFFLVSVHYKSDRKAGINIQWGNNNLFGNAQRISVSASYKTDFYGEYSENVELNYSEPYFLGTSLIFSSYIKAERIGYGERNLEYIELSPSLGKRISASGVLYSGLVFRRAWIDTASTENELKFSMSKFTNSFVFGYSFDSRDNPFSPTTGLKQDIRFQVAGKFLGGDNYFYRMGWDWVRLISSSKLGCYIFLRSTWTFPYDRSLENGISPDQKLTLGGVNSLRGYPENSLGDIDELNQRSGNILVNGMTQAHYTLGDFAIEVFFDAGGLWNSAQDISSYENIGFSLGTGFIYNTPAGPLRLEFGVPLAGEHRYKGLIQFAFGNPF